MTVHKDPIPHDVVEQITENVNRSLDTKLANVVKIVNAHTEITVKRFVDSAVEELAGITARRVDSIEEKVDKGFARVENHFEDIKDHLIKIDDRMNLRPRFEFRES